MSDSVREIIIDIIELVGIYEGFVLYIVVLLAQVSSKTLDTTRKYTECVFLLKAPSSVIVV